MEDSWSAFAKEGGVGHAHELFHVQLPIAVQGLHHHLLQGVVQFLVEHVVVHLEFEERSVVYRLDEFVFVNCFFKFFDLGVRAEVRVIIQNSKELSGVDESIRLAFGY